MATLIKYQSHVLNAQSFTDRFTGSVDKLYLAIAKSDAWTNGDENPDAVLDNVDTETVLWSELIGMQRITESNIMLCVPRVDWAENVAFTTFDTDAADAYSKLPGFFTYSENFPDYTVHECVVANGTTGSTPPTNTTGTAPTPDGFEWKFLYDLSEADRNNLLLDNWLPVNYGESASAKQVIDGTEDAYQWVGARYVMVKAVLTPPRDGGLPEVSYRKTCLVTNPLDNVGAPLVTDVILAAEASATASGQLLHIEHKAPITRIDAQEETITFVLEF